MSTENKCKFCHKKRKLVEAHIVPRSFFKHIRADDRQASRIYSTQSWIFPKKTQTGIYDDSILCEHCERRFNPWDTYAAEFLIPEFGKDGFIYDDKGKGKGYVIEKYDYAKLKLFFLSVMWRASVSGNRYFRNIQLGLHESNIRQMLDSNDPGHPDVYPIFLTRFIDEFGMYSMMDPYRDRLDNRNYNILNMAGYRAFIKTDKQDIPRLFAPLTLQPDRPLLIYTAEITDKAEFGLMKKMIHNASKQTRGRKIT